MREQEQPVVVFDRRQGEQRGVAAPSTRLQKNRSAVRCDRRPLRPSFCVGKKGQLLEAWSFALREQLARPSRAVALGSQKANPANMSAATSNFATAGTRVIDMTGGGAKPQDGQSGVDHPLRTAIWPSSCDSDYMTFRAEVAKGTLCLQ
jgi:hypothetical protein